MTGLILDLKPVIPFFDDFYETNFYENLFFRNELMTNIFSAVLSKVNVPSKILNIK